MSRPEGGVFAQTHETVTPLVSRSLRAVAFTVMRRHATAFTAAETGARADADPDPLHDMRVATRRIRAALAFFAGVLPESAQLLKEEMAWAGGVLGEVRDLDVHLRQISHWREEASGAEADALLSIDTLLRRLRVEARGRMVVTLDSPRFQRLAASAASLAALADPAYDDSPPAHAAAPDLIRRRWRRFKKAGDRIHGQSDADAFHALRIRCKRLRYAVEFHADYYGEAARACIAGLVDLQDLLGAHQDANVARARVLAMVSGAAGDGITAGLPRNLLDAVSRVADRHGREAEKARRRFPEVYANARGENWRTLKRLMNSLRPSDSRPAAVAAAAE
ncbi:MAG: CHAD domain-containing protein [Planctomycetes bacterium]|nr:CHAD domain-containing protein [Planctomycetota bacterium]